MDPITPNPDRPVYGPLNERIAIRHMRNTALEVHAETFGITDANPSPVRGAGRVTAAAAERL